MASALGMCTGMHIAGYLKRHNIEYSGFEVTVDNESAESPRRCGRFITRVTLKADLDERQLRELRDEANRCYVGNTLKSGAEIDVRLEIG
ncbi:OsmC family protein, partial [Candidatus Bathyarchaeota archaeon]|nr:OsmC family protein [Candidatus Bathyarchaeota archaeon]